VKAADEVMHNQGMAKDGASELRAAAASRPTNQGR
jgi:hypothetical protein